MDGDGWAFCAQGHRHWGVHGAAGLLLWHGGAVLLQHRALWSHHGGTWGLLGGARRRAETAEQAAAREAAEEAGLPPGSYTVTGTYVDDHGGWSYTTVAGRATVAPRAHGPHRRDHRGAVGPGRRAGRAPAAPRIRGDLGRGSPPRRAPALGCPAWAG